MTIRGDAGGLPSGAGRYSGKLAIIFTVALFLMPAAGITGVADAMGPDRLYAMGYNGSFVPPGTGDSAAPGTGPGIASLYVRDPQDGRLLSTLPLDEPGYFLAGDSSAARLYAANGYSKNVTVVDLARETATKVAMSSPPYGLALSSDGSRLYAALPAENAIGVIDAVSLAPLAPIPLNDTAFTLALSSDGSLLYAIGGPNGVVTTINVSGGRPAERLAVEVGLSEAVVAHNTLFVGSPETDSVLVIAGSGAAIEGAIGGVIAPDYIVYDAAKDALIAASRADGNLTKIDATGRNVTVTRSFWSSRYGRPAVSRDGSTVYVADDASRVRVINASSLVQTGGFDAAYPVIALAYLPPQDIPVEPSPSPTPLPTPGPAATGGPTGNPGNPDKPVPPAITGSDILLVLLGIGALLVILSGITYLMMIRKKE